MELELESLRKEVDDEPLECLRNGSADCDLFGGVKQLLLAKLSSPILLHLLVGEGTTDADVGLSGETLLVSVTIELIPVPQQGGALRVAGKYPRCCPRIYRCRCLARTQ